MISQRWLVPIERNIPIKYPTFFRSEMAFSTYSEDFDPSTPVLAHTIMIYTSGSFFISNCEIPQLAIKHGNNWSFPARKIVFFSQFSSMYRWDFPDFHENHPSISISMKTDTADTIRYPHDELVTSWKPPSFHNPEIPSPWRNQVRYQQLGRPEQPPPWSSASTSVRKGVGSWETEWQPWKE